MKKRTLVLGLTVAATVLSTQSVFAHKAGDIIVRAGVATVAPDENSSALNIPALGGEIGGSSARVDNNSQLGITGSWMQSNSWGLGLLAATPFKHDVDAVTGDLGLGTVGAGTVKHLPPTLTVQFFPLPEDSRFQPYVGAGVNYTVFFDESVDRELESVLGKGKLDLKDSWGLALEAGVDLDLGNNWLLNAAVWYLDIDTDAKFRFDSGVTVATSVDIDPWVYALAIGYKF